MESGSTNGPSNLTWLMALSYFGWLQAPNIWLVSCDYHLISIFFEYQVLGFFRRLFSTYSNMRAESCMKWSFWCLPYLAMQSILIRKQIDIKGSFSCSATFLIRSIYTIYTSYTTATLFMLPSLLRPFALLTFNRMGCFIPPSGHLASHERYFVINITLPCLRFGPKWKTFLNHLPLVKRDGAGRTVCIY